MRFPAWASVTVLYLAGCGDGFTLELVPALVPMTSLEARVGVTASPAGVPIELSAELLDFNRPWPGAWSVQFDAPTLTGAETSLLAKLPTVEGPPVAVLRVTGVRGTERRVTEGVLDLRRLGTWTPEIRAPAEHQGGQPLEVTIATTGFNLQGTLRATLWFELTATGGGAATAWEAEVSSDRTRNTLATWTASYTTLSVTTPQDATLTLNIRFEPSNGGVVLEDALELKRPVRIVP